MNHIKSSQFLNLMAFAAVTMMLFSAHAITSKDENAYTRKGVYLGSYSKLKKKIPEGYGVIFMRLNLGMKNKNGKFKSLVSYKKGGDVHLGFTFNDDPIVLTVDKGNGKNNWSPKADETYHARGKEIAILVPKEDRFLKYVYFIGSTDTKHFGNTIEITKTYMDCPIDAPIVFGENDTYLYVGDIYCELEKSKAKKGKSLIPKAVYIKDGLDDWMKKSFIKSRLKKGVDAPTKQILEGLPDSDESEAEDVVWLPKFQRVNS